MKRVNTLVVKKQLATQLLMKRTSLQAVRSMAAMQSRPIPFLATVPGAPPTRDTLIVGQVRYEPPVTDDLSTSYDPVSIARNYATAGVHAVSMFTDVVPEYDDTVDLTLVNDAMQHYNIPVITQNYMLNEYNIVAARAKGASVTVLTSGIVDTQQLPLLISIVHRNRMTAVVDVFSEDQLKSALGWRPQVIGLSRSDPFGEAVDFKLVKHLRNMLPPEQRVMITRPLKTAEDLHAAAPLHVDAVVADATLLDQHTVTELQSMLRSGAQNAS